MKDSSGYDVLIVAVVVVVLCYLVLFMSIRLSKTIQRVEKLEAAMQAGQQ